MNSVGDSAKKIYNTLYNIYFRIVGIVGDNNWSKNPYLLEQKTFQNALDSIAQLYESCSRTMDDEFNKTVKKVLGTVGSFLLYYYQGGTRYIDKYMYANKFLLDLESVCQAADFFYKKYVEKQDCCLILLECKNDVILLMQIMDRVDKDYRDALVLMPLRMFEKNERIKIKRPEDDEYTVFKVASTHLITSWVFSVVDGKIVFEVDTEKWKDSVWNL